MKNVPQLRFAGFDGEWEEKKINDLAEFFSGGTPTSDNSSYYNGSIPFIRSGEIHSNKTELYISEEALSNSSAKMVSKGDLVYALYGATSGEADLIRMSGAINQAILAIKLEVKHNPIFILNYLNKNKNYVLNKYLQGGQGNLSGQIVRNIDIILPKSSEQEKIGDLFRKIDALIEKQEGKVSKMEDFKKSMLQKTFPQKGKLVPDFRFEGFDGKWEKEKLNNITSKFDNLRIPIKESLRTKGPYPYHGATGIQDYVDDYIFDGEYILIAEDGASDINNYPLQRTSGRFWVNNHAHVIQAKDGNNNDFIFYSLSQINFEQYLVGGTRKKLNSSSMDEILLLLPSKEEQEKIGQFFKNLDTQIETEEKLLVSYKQMKKSLLQKMFV